MSYHLYLMEHLNEEELEEMHEIENKLHDLRKEIDKVLIRQTHLHNRSISRHRENQLLHCKYCHTHAKGLTNCSNCGAPR